jgi:hypothetical protein
MAALAKAQVGRRETVMIRHPSNSRRAHCALAALIAVGFWPVAAEAAVLAFRNETESPVMVQGVTIINRVARRGKLHFLGPGEVSQEPIVVPGTIRITVIDAKQPNHILCEQIIQFTGTNLFYAIQREAPEKVKEGNDSSVKAKSRRAPVPKVKLVPSNPIPQSTKTHR